VEEITTKEAKADRNVESKIKTQEKVRKMKNWNNAMLMYTLETGEACVRKSDSEDEKPMIHVV
jgi:hypothetical protein